MMKLPLLIFALSAVFFSCTRRFECTCNYKQRSFELNDQNEIVEVKTDTLYRSYISYTSKKLATEECDERGRSLMMDSLKVESSCGVVRYRD
jgi:hypothetical protein